MKHERKHREEGGRNDAAEDVDKKTQMRVNAPEIEREADEKKRGGRAKRKRGGMAEHKHVEMHGEHEAKRADRKPRKDGGRTGADAHPFSSARKGETPPGRKEMAGYD